MSVGKLLMDTAKQVRQLHEDAGAAADSGDPKGRQDNLTRVAEVLIALPALLKGRLDGYDPEIRRQVVSETNYWATRAKEALEEQHWFTIATLLIPRGSRWGDPNDLERLAETVSLASVDHDLVTCPYCGEGNPEGSRKCLACGGSLYGRVQ